MRKMAATILALAMLVLSAVPALGATVDQGKLKELQELYQQKYTIQTQIIEKKVKAGILDQTKADKIMNKMKEHQQRINQDFEKGEFHDFGPKKGCGQKPSNAQKTE
ncbi:DUF2680 domain-containing protein [Desulfosporosinus fructosivorans]|uniref:DUF2680 domain-containing protein n=1 Tax=Desulfosporosinus fructosivorans TaxID=2018669 RepID=A0A4Z0QXJ2_9FIRM|nr:DUF2680 domain-containing protein [Desulfosporosinus fructosivorans]TGE35224.1 DUF2680 domain-containing protein [Desulfosporosinus fructosivorans]